MKGCGGGDAYNFAALQGYGEMDDESYNSAALRGYGDMDDDESYNEAALRGFGCECDDESYNTAAMRGFGSNKKFVKGSPEAKAFMAHLRSLRGKNSIKKGGECVKKKKEQLMDGGESFDLFSYIRDPIPTAAPPRETKGHGRGGLHTVSSSRGRKRARGQ